MSKLKKKKKGVCLKDFFNLHSYKKILETSQKTTTSVVKIISS